jgi:hypothetical protein
MYINAKGCLNAIVQPNVESIDFSFEKARITKILN